MNTPVEVKIDGRLEAEVARILRGIPEFTVSTTDPSDGGPDIVVRTEDVETAMVVEVKSRANVASARSLVEQAQHHAETPLLLVLGETTADARRLLTDNHVAFVDGLGNAVLDLPGLILRVAGTTNPAKAASAPTRLSGKAGRIAQTLLHHRDRAWHLNELADETGVSQGFVHRVVARLGDENLVQANGDGPARTRTVVDPGALLDLWVEEQRDKTIRTYGYQLAQTQQQGLVSVTESLDDAGIVYAVTGAAAASLVAPLLTSVLATEIWVKATTDPRDLIDHTPVDSVEGGHNVVFLQARDDDPLAFRKRQEGIWIANIFRLYLDLRNDPRRGAEQADHLRQELIEF